MSCCFFIRAIRAIRGLLKNDHGIYQNNGCVLILQVFNVRWPWSGAPGLCCPRESAPQQLAVGFAQNGSGIRGQRVESNCRTSRANHRIDKFPRR